MRFGFHKAVLLAGAGAIMAPGVAAAQEARTLPGMIDSAAQTFELSVPAGSVMTIDVISTSDLDPVLSVTDAQSGEMLGADDDGGEGVNSRLRIPGGAKGREIMVEVSSFDAAYVAPGESYGGSFDLVLTTAAYTPPGPVTYGARVAGTVSVPEESVEYSFTASAGDMIEVALLSESELDPYLELRDASGEAIAFDDDGGSDVNALLRHTFDNPGTYTIAAMGFGGSTGDYTLRVNERRDPPAPQLPLQVIDLNDPATGTLGEAGVNDVLLPTSIDYQLSEAALRMIRNGGGRVTIRMDAAEGGDPDFGGTLDPVLEVGFDTPLGWAPALFDDDGGSGLNALLTLDLGALEDDPALLAMLRIRALGFGGTQGSYTLTITPGR